jgi:hypothetical protein
MARGTRKAAAAAPSPAEKPAADPAPATIEAAPLASSPAENPATDPAADAPIVEPVADAVSVAASAEAVAVAVAEEDHGADARMRLLGRAHDALHDALDALHDVARAGGFVAGTAAEQALAAAAERGFNAVRKALDDARDDIGIAVSMLRYEGRERRSFELVKDVLLDGTYYGPSHEAKVAPLTEGQHAELKAVEALGSDWADGLVVEAD